MVDIRDAHAVIDEAAHQFQLDMIFALLSGGNDSLSTTHIVSSHPLFKGVIHIDTGTGLPETQAFVRTICEKLGWDLTVQAAPGFGYLPYLMKFGFPGAPQHRAIYNNLKDKALVEALRVLNHRYGVGNKKPRIGLITGVRSSESVRRMGNVEPIKEDRSKKIWVAPLHNWTKTQVRDYIDDSPVTERNPASQLIGMSGECGCGAFARPNERRMLQEAFPRQYKRICGWENVVRTAYKEKVLPEQVQEKHLTWGWSGVIPDEQMQLPIIEDMPMCFNCVASQKNAEGQPVVDIDVEMNLMRSRKGGVTYDHSTPNPD